MISAATLRPTAPPVSTKFILPIQTKLFVLFDSCDKNTVVIGFWITLEYKLILRGRCQSCLVDLIKKSAGLFWYRLIIIIFTGTSRSIRRRRKPVLPKKPVPLKPYVCNSFLVFLCYGHLSSSNFRFFFRALQHLPCHPLLLLLLLHSKVPHAWITFPPSLLSFSPWIEFTFY